MEFVVIKRFKKMFKNCPEKIKKQLNERLELFLINPNHQLLNNHSLSGHLKGFRSINISSDWRVLYEERDEKIILSAIGTHNQLYK